uniref:SHSP domain-containing protein n=1 Tax=Erythrolobus australicus TaxID=1077150 RepID=A0A7S1XIZ2_9RHOD|mmetsp:Transcript_3577/g.9950  ORF Transcript_3577/g.9950 Transcript_3577/m.9950 type:complete len:232 (+) Transcript_3577:162-857(+)
MAFVGGVVPVTKQASLSASCSSFARGDGAVQPVSMRRVAAGGVSMMFGPQYYRGPRARVCGPTAFELSMMAPLLGLGLNMAARSQSSAPSPVQSVNDVERVMNNRCDPFDSMWQPRYKIDETETEFVLMIEAPGIPREQISLEIKDDTMTVTGGAPEQKAEEQKDGDAATQSRSFQRSFRRSFRVGPQVDKDKIRAVVKDGIVRVRMPKIEQEVVKTRKIEIEDDSDIPAQ